VTLKKLCKCGKVIEFNQKCCEVCSKKQKEYRKQYNKLEDMGFTPIFVRTDKKDENGLYFIRIRSN